MQFRLSGREIALPKSQIGVATATLFSIAVLATAAHGQFFELSQQANARQRAGSSRMVSPAAKVDAAAYQRAIDYRAKMRPAQLGGGNTAPRPGTRGVNIAYTSARWEFFGPYNLQPRFINSQGPTASFMSGRVNSVAFDNRTQGIFYVAAASGGAWKGDTTSGSLIWTPLGDKFPYPETSSVATDPTNGRILYVGLGDFYGRGSGPGEGLNTPRFFGNATATGIMKSVNGGNTFVNIGRFDASGNVAMEGTAVSSIVVHPSNPRILVASTGRGTNPGSLWYTTDGGAKWNKPTLKRTGAAVPAGDWNTVRIFNPYGRAYANQKVGDPQFLYASRVNDGIYRSDDRGATWRKITNTPLNFNQAGFGGDKTLIVTPSATDPYVIYVMDTSSIYDDGRIYRGQPQNRSDMSGTQDVDYLWTEITGNYNTANGAYNNWSRSEYASAMVATPASFLLGPTAPAPYTNTIQPMDIVYGGNRTLSASLGADRFNTFTLLNETNLWHDITFSQAGGNPPVDRIHSWQRDIKYDPFDPETVMVANDGGVYLVSYDKDNIAPGFAGTSGANWFPQTDLNTSGDIAGASVDVRKQSFGITQINGADFHPTDPNYALAGTQHLGMARFPTGATGWVNVGADPKKIIGSTAGVTWNYVGNTAIAGTREYAWVLTNGAKHLVVTANNWASVRDITPDQFHIVNGQNGPETHYPFPYTDVTALPDPPDAFGSTNSTVASAYGGQTKAENPVITVDTNGSTSGGANFVYIGTNALWRYHPTLTETGFDGTSTGAGVGGQWRQIGTQTFGGVITAIAVTRGPEDSTQVFDGQRIYVGTSTGELWMTNDNARNFTNNQGSPATSNATWRQINNTTLPVRPITSISVNPTLSGGAVAHPEDILVTLGGTGSGHVYRAQDTRASTVAFTDQSGLITNGNDPNFFTRLPDIPVNGIVRDSQDPTNTWYVATDIGVFVTTDQGSTWQDATTPLGLPNVQCTAIKYVPGTNYLNVATYGRGLWRIKTSNQTQVDATPNLVSSFTLNRIGNEIFAVVTITNVQRKDSLGNNIPTGVAENVKITASSILRATNVSTTTALPLSLGANPATSSIAPGTSRSLTLRFPGTVGTSGSAVTFKLAGTYVTQTTTGPVTNNTAFPDVRTRLP